MYLPNCSGGEVVWRISGAGAITRGLFILLFLHFSPRSDAVLYGFRFELVLCLLMLPSPSPSRAPWEGAGERVPLFLMLPFSGGLELMEHKNFSGFVLCRSLHGSLKEFMSRIE
ncbi:hypothetical protein MNBD_PLANCTO03-2214 [hydrothermal vent metagenome]|uniref:Uncharacterized protein n=1 Tax=hydrothermal vent metagenome TaxID=652676 RepID=A0A3B1DPF3_9ZZZZ